MATERTPSRLNISFAPEIDGRPVDNGIFVAQNTEPYFHYGKRLITWDGKVYKYSKSEDICYTGRGNVFQNTISGDANGIDYSVLAAAAPATSTYVVMTNGSTALAKDYLAGGNIVMKPTETYTDAQLMFR